MISCQYFSKEKREKKKALTSAEMTNENGGSPGGNTIKRP